MLRNQHTIDRRSGLSVDDIYSDHLNGIGLPVILTDAINTWPALSSWDLNFFSQKYGSATVAVGTGVRGKSRRVMKLAHFIDYVIEPSRPPRGFWLNVQTMMPREETLEDKEAPLYLHDQRLLLDYPELLDDVQPQPACLDDWLSLLPEDVQRLLQGSRYYQRGILIGPENSIARLHCDFLHSHAYLAQIRGTKLCYLFSPEDSEKLYDGKVCPEMLDFEKHPLFAYASAYVCYLEPRELLLIPNGWWHYVRNLEKSITVNYNFFNRVNFGNYVNDLSEVLPAILGTRSETTRQENREQMILKAFEQLGQRAG